MGTYFLNALKGIKSPHIKEIRGKGLMIGVELFPQAGGARKFCEKLKEKGLEVQLMRFSDEGHGLAKLENRIKAYSRVLTWLNEIA